MIVFQIRSVVLIDCGATVDLAELLSVAPQMMIYLVDSHRPVHLNNVFGNSQLFVLDDGFIEENINDLELAYQATTGESLSSENDEDEDGDESEDDNADNNGDDETEATLGVEDENRNPNRSAPNRDRQRIERELKREVGHFPRIILTSFFPLTASRRLQTKVCRILSGRIVVWNSGSAIVVRSIGCTQSHVQ